MYIDADGDNTAWLRITGFIHSANGFDASHGNIREHYNIG